MAKKTLQYVNGHFELRNPEDPIDDVAFNKLSDCPSSYTGNSLKVVRVKSTEDGLEFASAGSGGYDGDPTVIVQDSTHRFVSDAEKSTWNSKANALGADDNYVTDAEKVKLSNLSGTNTGDQDLSTYFKKDIDDSDDITEGATKLFLTSAERTKLTNTSGTNTGDQTTTAGLSNSTNKNLITDAQLTVLTNTSGTNTGDNATNSQYSGLAASKQDTLVSGTNIKTINGSSVLGSGDLTVGGSAPTGVFNDLQISVLQSDGTLNAASGVQTWAGTNKTGQDVFTVSANTTYIVEGMWYVNTGATTHTTAIAWALSTATVTDFQYQVTLWSAAANTIATTQSNTHVSGVASKVLNATSTAVYTIIQFKGIIVIGTGGTITPQINFSANPTGTNLMKRGSFTSFSKLFTDTDTTRGTWA